MEPVPPAVEAQSPNHWTAKEFPKIANIYIDSRYALGVVHDFGMLWKQHGFPSLPVEIKCKMALIFRNYWMQYFYLPL